MENVKKKINIALIGLGWVSTHRHLPTIAADERFKIVGVIDKHPGRAADIAKKYGCYSAETQDIRTVPWMNEVDAVTVSVQPMLHYEMIKTALMLNKHVITEKPFAMTVNEGQELVNLAREKHLKLGVVHNFQFASSTQKMIKDIEDGKYGAIKAISAVQMGNPGRRLPVWYEKLPLGLFYDESPHFFYLLSKLSPGPLEHIGSDIFPSTTGLNTPAQIFMKYRAKCGSSSTPVTVSLNFESPVSEWHLMIFGEKCLGDIDIFRDIYMCLPNDGLHVTSTVFRTSLIATWQHWAQNISQGIKHLLGTLRYGNEIVFGRFAEAVLNDTPMEGVGAEDALRILKMQHEVINNAKYLYK